MLTAIPGKAQRACAVAMNKTGKLIKQEEQAEMMRVFDRPTKFTLNSLQLTPATSGNLEAKVWFKEPARMGQHYLVPQVEGGSRKLKGFERAISLGELVPGQGSRKDQSGNISIGQIRQLLSVLGKAERGAGYSANITNRSRKRNNKQRDYVVIYKRHGRLLPGVYQRVHTGVGFGAKTKRTFADRSKVYQKGRTRGRFSSVIRARGLKPIMLLGQTGHQVKPLFDFYGVANRVCQREFEKRFWETLDQFLQS